MVMKLRSTALFYIIVIGLIFSAPFISSRAFSVYAQFGNSISGYVYGLNRQPMGELSVELLDEFGRTVGRTRTNGSGYYAFNGVSAGNFSVRVYTFGTDYEEQENTVNEIVNITS